MGEGRARPRGKYAHGRLEDDRSSDSDQDSEPGDENQAAREREDALVESAMRRIRRAQAKGKQEVKLNKKELAALEQRRKRIEAEASGENKKKKKKKKEHRYAVPLSQLGPISQKESRAPRASDDALPRHPSPELLARTQGGKAQPPVGWFAHPSSSRSGTSDSHRAFGQASDREGSSSPFQYSYVHPPAAPSNPRHSSDPSVRPRSTRGPVPHEDARMVQYGASASVPAVASTLDPFRFMTSGLQTPYHAGSAASLRNDSSSSAYLDPSYAGGSSRRQSRQISPDATESEEEDDDEDELSDEMDAGVRIGSLNPGSSNGREQIIIESDREPTPPIRPATRSTKRVSSHTTSPKRKPVGSGHSRKKKGSK